MIVVKKTALSLVLIFSMFSAIFSATNLAIVDASETVVVSNQRPQVSISSIVSGANATLNLTGTIDHAAVFDKNGNWVGNMTNNGSNFSYTITSLPVGNHSFTVKASNVKGIKTSESNLTTKQVTVTVKSPKITTREYGRSGNGRPLTVVSIEPEKIDSKVLAVFEIHGYEDSYNQDGQVLCDIANEVISYFSNHPEQLGNTALYIVPMANPDGLLDGWTNNGPGRCQTSLGVDINRDFDYCWNYYSNNRNKTLSPFSAPESQALRDLVISIQPNDVVDFHGWLSTTYGTSSLCQIFGNELGVGRSSGLGGCPGYFAAWATNYAQRTALIELRSPSTDPQKVINGFINLCNATN